MGNFLHQHIYTRRVNTFLMAESQWGQGGVGGRQGMTPTGEVFNKYVKYTVRPESPSCKLHAPASSCTEKSRRLLTRQSSVRIFFFLCFNNNLSSLESETWHMATNIESPAQHNWLYCFTMIHHIGHIWSLRRGWIGISTRWEKTGHDTREETYNMKIKPIGKNNLVSKALSNFAVRENKTTHDGHNNSKYAVPCSPLVDALRTLRHHYLMTKNQNIVQHEWRTKCITSVAILQSYHCGCCMRVIACWEWRLGAKIWGLGGVRGLCRVPRLGRVRGLGRVRSLGMVRSLGGIRDSCLRCFLSAVHDDDMGELSLEE
jgi:hypothetical protein